MALTPSMRSQIVSHLPPTFRFSLAWIFARPPAHPAQSAITVGGTSGRAPNANRSDASILGAITDDGGSGVPADAICGSDDVVGMTGRAGGDGGTLTLEAIRLTLQGSITAGGGNGGGLGMYDAGERMSPVPRR
jgi:hypothetical protein